MRLQEIVTRTLLILFIVTVSQFVDFVSGAPVAAREKLEWRIDVNIAEDGTATLQKRVNPVEESSTNMEGQTPPSPDRTEVDQLWQEMRENGMLLDTPTPLKIPGWSTPPYGEGSSTGSRSGPSSPLSPWPEGTPLESNSMSVPPSRLTTPLSEERFPPAWSLTVDTLSTTGRQPTPQQSLGPDPNSDMHPSAHWQEPHSPLPNPEPPRPMVAEMPMDVKIDYPPSEETEMPIDDPKGKSPEPIPVSHPLQNPVQSPVNPEPHRPTAPDMPMEDISNMETKPPVQPPLDRMQPPPPPPPPPPPRLDWTQPPLDRMQPPPPPRLDRIQPPLDRVRPPLYWVRPSVSRGRHPPTLVWVRPQSNPVQPLSDPVQSPSNPEPHRPTGVEMSMDDFLDMLMHGRV